MDNRGNIVIFQTKDGKTSIDVKLENETVWLTLNQIAELFSRDKSVISRHISNVFNEGELERNSVVAKNATTASDGKMYQVEYFNLDVIISVGYRVKSQRGTQFRIWANKILKDYLIKGYAINQQAKAEQLEDLKSTVRLLSNVIEHKQLTLDEANGLLRVITDYTYGLDTLDKYDYQQLEVTSTTTSKEFRATYDEAMNAIRLLQKKFGSSDLFGNEKDQSFKSSINTIYQTFGGEELYPSIEEKAAMLFYLVVKNHSFSDGNKRIAAFLFLWFLERNDILYKPDGSKLIGNNTLVALTLMIAESRTEEKDMMVKVVINLINKNN
ncbi:RhuM family protein [Bacteroides sp. GM023]|uniref:RhuM family protein n=1 Tax=Bacteroides sp. GM023 TaxID=2723058 RepID=UPI00168AB103|nr:RhuM family protein [Bacteroides sp. GM023]MBD3588455.1 cytochrome C biogenesis protein CycH [Bacteroides sp. GM023]